MTKSKKQIRIKCPFFTWRLYCRQGMWYADGRGNTPDPGRHSLGVRLRGEAEQNLAKLDWSRAVDLGLAAPKQDRLTSAVLSLAQGRKLYEEHLNRPRIAGGVRESTKKRYRTVFDKFLEFAAAVKVSSWNEVTSKVLMLYTGHLEQQHYRSKTLRNELTTLGQAMRWLSKEGHLVGVDLPQLKLRKVESERAYCYEPAEVGAMIEHCRSQRDLGWLANVIVGLACTGLRISELASLQWADIDFERGMLSLTDESGARSRNGGGRQLKSGRSRSLPLHPELIAVLRGLPRTDATVFHGPRGGRIKPDTVRNILTREVIQPLSSRFPRREGLKSFADGRLHSFRHYFASMCANQGTAERIAMEWLGHADSEMVRHYYHLHDDESRKQMAKLVLLETAGKQSPGNDTGTVQTTENPQHEHPQTG